MAPIRTRLLTPLAAVGLAVARGIARAHGGDVVLSNREGGGLRARVTIPLATAR